MSTAPAQQLLPENQLSSQNPERPIRFLRVLLISLKYSLPLSFCYATVVFFFGVLSLGWHALPLLATFFGCMIGTTITCQFAGIYAAWTPRTTFVTLWRITSFVISTMSCAAGSAYTIHSLESSGSSRSTTPIGIVILLSFSAVVYGSDLGYAKATKEAASGRAEGGLRETGELLGDWAWQVRRLASGIKGVSQTQVELQEEQQQGATARPMNELSTQAIRVPSDKSQNWLEHMIYVHHPPQAQDPEEVSLLHNDELV